MAQERRDKLCITHPQSDPIWLAQGEYARSQRDVASDIPAPYGCGQGDKSTRK